MKDPYQGQLELCIQIAAKQHAGQLDQHDMPYILHVLRVMMRAKTMRGKCIAALHDTVEDTKITAKDLRKAGVFDDIISGVLLLTRNDVISYTDYIVAIAASGDDDVIDDKISDLKDNFQLERMLLRMGKKFDRDLERVRRYALSFKFLKAFITKEEYLSHMIE